MSLKLTDIDSNQIHRYAYDEDHRAIRMINVSGQAPQVNSNQSVKTTTETKIERIEVPVIIKQTQIEKIEIPTVIKEIEYREVEKPVYIKEFVEVQVPVLVKELQIERVEIPVVHKEIQIVHVDKMNYKMLFAMQAVTLILIVISRFIK